MYFLLFVLSLYNYNIYNETSGVFLLFRITGQTNIKLDINMFLKNLKRMQKIDKQTGRRNFHLCKVQNSAYNTYFPQCLQTFVSCVGPYCSVVMCLCRVAVQVRTQLWGRSFSSLFVLVFILLNCLPEQMVIVQPVLPGSVQ